jgi:hypothetical protein
MTNSILQDYAEFVCRRQSVLLNKIYTSSSYVDPVLGTNKFTNVQRIFDRVSQYELKEVLYTDSQKLEDLILRVFIFNQFKTEAFWKYLKSRDYCPEFKSFNAEEFTRLITEYSGKDKLFTSAYVVPGKSGESKAETIAWRAEWLTKVTDWSGKGSRKGLTLFNILTEIRGIGSFLASQVVFDLLWHESFKDWQPLYTLGVGAVRGAFKLGLIPNANKVTPQEAEYALKKALEVVQESEYPYATANRQNVELNPADIQNTFCETDKWFRLTHPELQVSKSSPTRIKNVYKPRAAIEYKVPGWWVGAEGIVTIDKVRKRGKQ